MTHPDFPGERLVACRNPELAKLRAHKRQALLAATGKELDKVRGMVGRGTLRGRDAIGLRVGKVVNEYKVAKHVRIEIQDARLEFQIDEQRVAAEAALDSIYVIRTSVPAARLDAADAVRHCKRLSDVERAFRSPKTIDLKVRPIHHRLEERVRAHIFLCLLAYYVEWHMREAWRPLLFSDEDQQSTQTRDPVAPAQRSTAALRKIHTKVLDDGTPVHSFSTLEGAQRHCPQPVPSAWRRTQCTGAIPYPAVSPRFLGFHPKRVAEFAAGNPIFWYKDFLEQTVLPNATTYARLQAYGEVAVGLGLILGLLVGLASLSGLFLSLNFGLATQWMSFGQQGFHLLLVTSMLVFLGARAGRLWGVDWLLLRHPAARRPWLRWLV